MGYSDCEIEYNVDDIDCGDRDDTYSEEEDGIDHLTNSMNFLKYTSPDDEEKILIESLERVQYTELQYRQDILRFKRYVNNLNLECHNQDILTDIQLFMSLEYNQYTLPLLILASMRVSFRIFKLVFTDYSSL